MNEKYVSSMRWRGKKTRSIDAFCERASTANSIKRISTMMLGNLKLESIFHFNLE